MVFQGDDAYRDPLKNAVVLALAVLAAFGSLFVVLQSLPAFTEPGEHATVRAANAATGVFLAVLYVLLGLRPRRYALVWELVIAHRLVLVIGNGLLVAGGALGAAVALGRNLVIAALLIGAYLYGKGWHSWRTN